MARKDIKGRNLRVGEYYDEKNQRYMFRKMVDGERVTITAANLADLRKQESKTKRWQIREVLILRRITQDKTR